MAKDRRRANELAFNTRQAAAALGISRPTLSLILKRGELRHKRVGRRVLISREALKEFLGDKKEAT